LQKVHDRRQGKVMTGRTKHPLLQFLQRAALAQGDQVSDGQLLERFLQQRDQDAFAGLVQRHGPMVLGVCRRVLAHSQDAEDAFQATFLVLVRKGGGVWPRDRVGRWLYGVAYRTALEARTTRARRRVKEAQAPVPAAENEDAARQELRGELDQQLSRLPEKYRLPVLLCDLQGKTQQEAARQLGWPEGTVSGRLFRARQLLAERLKKQGIAVSVATLPLLLSQQVCAAVPADLASATVKAAGIWLAQPALASTVVSAQVTQLTEGVLRAMFIKRMKATVTICLAAGLLITLTWSLTQHLLASPQPNPQEQADAGPVAPQKQQPDPTPKPLDAKQTFDLMESKLLQAKTLHCKFDVVMKGGPAGGQSMDMKGQIFLGGQNKIRAEFEVNDNGKKIKIVEIADGNQSATIQDGKTKVRPLQKKMEKNLIYSLSHPGLTLPLLTVTKSGPGNEIAEADIKKLYPITEPKLGKAEKVGGKQAIVLNYQLQPNKGEEPTNHVTLWLDATTHLPLKRVVAIDTKPAPMTMTETYSDWSINGAIKPALFELPTD
jgi:RNA polymerase sigma factor (sigma-70 family)